MKEIRIIVINLGSTSTKIAYFADDKCVVSESVFHPSEELAGFSTVFEQYEYRKKAVLDFMARHGIDIKTVDAFSARGGQTHAVEGGTYRVNERMVAEAFSGDYGIHVTSVGCKIAMELCRLSGHAVPLTTDTPCTDELEPLARYSGLKEIERTSSFQALNQRAVAQAYAESVGKSYEDMDLVVVMLGGGISVVAHKKGRMVDGPDALHGDGAFSNNRACGLPVGQLIRLCYSGKFPTEAEMIRHVNGEGGLMSYLGTMNIREIMAEIEKGNALYKEVIDAMCYQTAKDVGAYSTVLCGQVDAILMTGGMANVKYITDEIARRVGFIAPVVVIPGEKEMEALGHNAYLALTCRIPIKEF